MSAMAPEKTELDGDIFYPSAEAVAQTYVPDWEATAARASQDLAGYWAGRAKELEWYRPWDTVLDESNKPFYKWFVGGQVNIVNNCLDRHVHNGRGDKAALIWEPDDPATQPATYTYSELFEEVCEFANVLKKHGIKKGDRVAIYMPMIPELAVAMLACVLLGPWAGFLVMVVVLAIQCLIFADGGFAALGANIFNMALIAGPVCYFMFAASKSLMNKRLSERTSLLTSLAFFSWLSVVLAGAACAVELSISNVVKLSSGAIFGPIVGVNAIIGIGEAVITTIVVAVVLQARPDLVYSYSGHDVKLPLSEEAV